MEAEIAHRHSATQWDAERLNRAVEVLVIDGVFIMPDSGGWIRHLVAENSDSIDCPGLARSVSVSRRSTRRLRASSEQSLRRPRK